MSLDVTHESRPIADPSELTDVFRSACKPPDQWRAGTESEALGVYATGPAVGAAPPYEGPRGIGALLARLATSGWVPIREGEHIIALARDGAHISLEPGGQIELAARPVSSVAVHAEDVRDYEQALAAASRELDIAWLGMGFRPFGTLDDVPWMPKGRYAIMRDYLPTRGRLAHEMMKRTATVQVSLDFSDVDDARAKLRCAFGITPLLTAMYASSPIVDGQVTDYQSYRARVWLETDPDRCGLLPFVFDDVDVFEAYTQWALDVPMFFVLRDRYLPARGMTFRRFLRDGFEGERATIGDWELHLSTLFPDVRIKRFIEVRGCDAGPRDMILALAPLLCGVLYDADARSEATALTASLTIDERLALAAAVPRAGFSAPVGRTGRKVLDLARELVAIADAGLARIEPGDRGYLEPLREIVATGRTRADAIVDVWRRAGGEPTAVIRSCRRFA